MTKLEEILLTRQFPSTKIQKDVSGAYDASLAKFPNDPDAFISSNCDRAEKAKRAGKELISVDQAKERLNNFEKNYT